MNIEVVAIHFQSLSSIQNIDTLKESEHRAERSVFSNCSYCLMN